MRRALLALWVAISVALTSSAAGAASEVWLPNGNAADPLTSAPQKRRPVLFVHGHNPDDANDADFNYRKNWVQAVDGLPSFQQTLDDPLGGGGSDVYVGLGKTLAEQAQRTAQTIDQRGGAAREVKRAAIGGG